ncbi:MULTISPECIES: hypothetical protein [Cyanophyceae]|uniref:hypothetical protein n=1 Tax=Cyanophyceae TaxID=3028117 RepID=UPI00016DC3C2|nr:MULTISPECIES: hypothetical protein [Cyanophyceae]ACB01088.1 hypothetical protein SYNPCC7002_G0048 [Picosynechococcus sp. PCC 7002]SMH48584.1 hypothetical protein SAMN06272755_1972 [Picosynechococcus sp. OG1]SMQ81353.1 hypothetical protein SAMN06272774_1249 [Synechococcus sp. 7002]
MSGKFGDIIGRAKQTSKPDNQIPNQQNNQQSDQSTETEKMVNLCVKVPKSLRQHWAAEAKRNGITMTEVIVDALNQKFGKP